LPLIDPAQYGALPAFSQRNVAFERKYRDPFPARAHKKSSRSCFLAAQIAAGFLRRRTAN
jgi:hypothetical protein